jgi:hypothetical protein
LRENIKKIQENIENSCVIMLYYRTEYGENPAVMAEWRII